MAFPSIAARHSPRLLRVTGALLVVLGGVHLVATPFYMGWASTQIRPENAALVAAGMRLNHILVGVLLLPLGLSTCWAARSFDEAWAFRQSVLNAVTTLCMPVLVVATMPPESLWAVPFLVAVIVLFLACTAQMIAVLGLGAARRR